MKKYSLLSLTLGGVLILGGIAPGLATANQSEDISQLIKIQKAQAAEIAALKKLVSSLQQSGPASTQAARSGSDVSKIEQQVASLQEFQADTENTLANRVQIHGTASQGYLHSDSGHLIAKNPGSPYDSSTFNFNEFAFNISADVTDKLRVGLQIMSRDFGPLMDNMIYLDWAIMDYAWKDELGLRAGRLKVPYGLYNESRDIDVARNSIFLPEGVYSELDRLNFNFVDGFGLYGSVDMSVAGILNYQTVYGDANLDVEGDTKAAGLTSFDVETEDLFTIQILWETPLEGLKVGGTYLQTEAHLTGNLDMSPFGLSASNPWYREYDYYHVYLASLEYTWNDIIIAAEYQETRSDMHDNLLGDLSMHPGGWYISGGYRFTDWFAAEIYYTEYYGDMDNKNGVGYAEDYEAWQKDWSFNTRFDINDHWIVKAGMALKNGLAGTEGIDPSDPDADAGKNWVLYQLKTTVFF